MMVTTKDFEVFELRSKLERMQGENEDKSDILKSEVESLRSKMKEKENELEKFKEKFVSFLKHFTNIAIFIYFISLISFWKTLRLVEHCLTINMSQKL